MTNLTAPRYTNEDKAREHLESLRWPNGPFCPHCGSFAAKRLPAVRGRATKAHPDGAVRAGVIQCNDCRKQYSVTVGTLYESSKVPLHKWLLANHLLCAGKKGVSAHQLHRMIGVSYKTAWFMFHRIREAMRDETGETFGGGGGEVEIDETYIGRDRTKKQGRAVFHHKMKVLSLIDRSTGRARSIVFQDFRLSEVARIVYGNVSSEARVLTDEASMYRKLGREFADHRTVTHGKGEYVRKGDTTTHTNTIEGFFSVFKRGMLGTYQHCGKQHLHRYTAEFDFRYSNRIANGIDDEQRADIALKNIAGRRLMYRRPNVAA